LPCGNLLEIKGIMSGESLKQILVDTLRGTKEEKNYRV
jgi:hypothetical protein